MFSSCGKIVQTWLKAYGTISTHSSVLRTRLYKTMDKRLIINRFIQQLTTTIPQLKIQLSPLFEHIFYPVSTTPIITKTRYERLIK